MKYFNSSKIAFLLACTLSATQQIQGAGGIPTELDLHQDYCMVGQFGETVNHATLATLINNAPADKLVDAFIACPDQMANICFERLYLEGDDSIIDALVKDSDKMEAFYNAVNTITKPGEQFTPDDGRRMAARQAIHAFSLIHGIPEHLFLASLKANPMLYIYALIDKAAFCRTEDEKAAMFALLQEARAALNEDPSSYLSRLTNYSINLLTGQKIEFDPNNFMDKLGVLFMSLAFSRFDVAEAIAASDMTLTLDLAKNFATKKHLKAIVDSARALGIVRKLLPEGDREAFDEHVKSVLA